MYIIISAVVFVDLIILIAWVVVAPLEYKRIEVSTTLDESTGVFTVETIGSCVGSTSLSMYVFLGPIIAIHVASMIITNVILWKVRNISDRYQEQKYVALASIYICELLLLGLPILFAVQDSGTASYIVIAGVIFLTDTGVVALILLPKIKFAKEGLPEGISVAQSVSLTRRPTRNSTLISGLRDSTFQSRLSSSYDGSNLESRAFSRNNDSRKADISTSFVDEKTNTRGTSRNGTDNSIDFASDVTDQRRNSQKETACSNNRSVECADSHKKKEEKVELDCENRMARLEGSDCASDCTSDCGSGSMTI